MGYSVSASINIAVDIVGCLVFLVLMISMWVNGDAQSRQGRIFSMFLLLTLISYLCELAAWAISAAPGTALWAVYVAANYLAYALQGSLVAVYMFYIYAYLPSMPKSATWLMRCTFVLTVLFQVLIIVNQFTGIIYSVDENGFHWGAYYALSPLWVILLQVMGVVFLVANHKWLGRRNTAILLTYLALPLLSLPVQIINPRIPASYVAVILAIIIIYVDFQAQQTRQLKLKMAERQTAIMLSQIQPHFLYNVLASINNLAKGNPEVRTAITTFASYLRGNLDSISQKKMVPFERELEHLRQYLWLEQLRYEERLQVVYELEATNFMLPVLTVQAIVENAVRHGIAPKEGGGSLRIKTLETADAFRITVQDDGRGFDTGKTVADGRSHTGLENVRHRLDVFCGGTLAVESTPGVGTTVVMEIPKAKEAAL